MMKPTLLALVLATTSFASTVRLVGSDPFHSVDLTVTNLSFHETAPAPGGNYFDYANTTTGNGAPLPLSQTLSVQIASNPANDSPWVYLPLLGPVALNGYPGAFQGFYYAPRATGEQVTFSLHQLDGQVFNTAIVLSESATFAASAAEAPEPATFALIGGALLALGVIRKRSRN